MASLCDSQTFKEGKQGLFQESSLEDHGRVDMMLTKTTLPETNSSHLKMMVFNRNLLFQGCIFRCQTVSFRENTWVATCRSLATRTRRRRSSNSARGLMADPHQVRSSKMRRPKNGLSEKNWAVVSKFFYFHPYLGKIPILTNIFQRG